MKFNSVALSAFKTSEYEIYSKITNNKKIPFIHKSLLCDKDFKLKKMEKNVIPISTTVSKTNVYDVIKKSTDLYLKSRNLPKKNKVLYLIINKKDEIINANFYLTDACDFLCKYVYKNEDNKVKNYRIEKIDVKVSDYVDYVKSLNQKKAS